MFKAGGRMNGAPVKLKLRNMATILRFRSGDDPSPLTPEANEKAIRDLPRDAETVELYKKFAGPGPIPPR